MKSTISNTIRASIALVALSFSFASAAEDGDTKTFKCLDKVTFAVNAECMSQQIESNLVFKQAEKAMIENIEKVSDRALATMTFDPKTMTIHVLAHKDASLAKVDVKN